uniref:Uncharacterized protein n=1 Tax=Romanomermis culicivorax TaxID=13658 RepID=A0A915IR74_ROMCU
MKNCSPAFVFRQNNFNFSSKSSMNKKVEYISPGPDSFSFLSPDFSNMDLVEINLWKSNSQLTRITTEYKEGRSKNLPVEKLPPPPPEKKFLDPPLVPMRKTSLVAEGIRPLRTRYTGHQ